MKRGAGAAFASLLFSAGGPGSRIIIFYICSSFLGGSGARGRSWSFCRACARGRPGGVAAGRVVRFLAAFSGLLGLLLGLLIVH